MLRAVLVALLVLPQLAVWAPAAQAQNRKGLKVTLVARECPTYGSIMANRARNDIQESLQDLGKDTVYGAQQTIDPDVEAANQPDCVPLNGWLFKLGTGYRSRAVTGPWGALSVVTGPYAGTPGPTADDVPLLNASGERVPGRTLDGAVTLELTEEQADRAARANSLWVEGGTVEDPVLNGPFPGQYGFGALRCAIDDLNGDNVEWIGYPSGASHVFCYAYYVKPPPTSGTIVVRKEVDAPEGTAATDFRFGGDVSYNVGGVFTLRAGPGRPATQTFYRASGQTWTVREEAAPGWELAALTCTSARSPTTTDPATEVATIALAAGDVVRCTYVNRLEPPAAGLTLGKVTLGATGSTVFDVAGPSRQRATVETTAPGEVATVAFPDQVAGDYAVSERPVDTPAGRWRRDEVRCNGRTVPDAPDPLPLTLAPGNGAFCVFYNEFVPAGSIRVRKRTLGGTGATGFIISRAGSDPAEVYTQSARTTRENVPELATGEATDDVPLGTYDIQETTTSNAGEGSWQLDQVTCDGVPYGSAQGRTRVRLTAENPSIDCVFTNRLTAQPPGQGGVLPATEESPAANPVADLSIRKRARPRRILAGEPVRYTVTVANRGDVVAEDVVATESRPPSGTRVRVVAPRGVRCRSTRPLICIIGDMAPGERVRLRATVRTPLVGRVINRVAVHTATREDRLGDNRARATVRVRRLPRFTG